MGMFGIARDGSLVISCLRHFLKSYVDRHERYEDRLSRWLAHELSAALTEVHTAELLCSCAVYTRIEQAGAHED